MKIEDHLYIRRALDIGTIAQNDGYNTLFSKVYLLEDLVGSLDII